MQIYGGIFAMQLYWNHTSSWVISSKFTAFLQNTFSEEHLWGAASGHLHYNRKHTVSCFLPLSSVIIHQFHSCTKNPTLILFIPTFSSRHSHPDSPHSQHSHPDSPHSHSYSPHSYSDSPHFHPYSSHFHPDPPHSPHLHHAFWHSHHLLHSVPRFPIPAFTDSH